MSENRNKKTTPILKHSKVDNAKAETTVTAVSAKDDLDISTQQLNTNPVVESVDVESNTNSSEEKSKLKEVEDFFKQHKTPELKEILLEQTQGFVEQILERRLKYNLLTQDVELDGTSLRRHQNETLDVVNRMLVVAT